MSASFEAKFKDFLHFCIFQTESPLYYAVMALHIMPPEKWKLQRVKFLERLLVLAHVRNTVALGGTRCV